MSSTNNTEERRPAERVNQEEIDAIRRDMEARPEEFGFEKMFAHNSVMDSKLDLVRDMVEGVAHLLAEINVTLKAKEAKKKNEK